MNILVPINKAQDVEKVVGAGANEVFCGVFPDNWKKKYSNIVSPNRREWTSASLSGFEELAAVTAAAHALHTPVCLTVNALYTEQQYPLVYEQVNAARECGVDALIVADMGLLVRLSREKTGLDIHISTGGTAFNSEAVRLYQRLGVSRITLSRHMRPDEIAGLVKDCPSMRFEVFILNSGCKNIDGFCTFLHGTAELKYGAVWKKLKKMNFDRLFLQVMQKLARVTGSANFNLFGVDSPCLLNYAISVNAATDKSAGQVDGVRSHLCSSFSFLAGADPCGACRIRELKNMGVFGLKIVGRNYAASKKVTDVQFVRSVLEYAETAAGDDDFRAWVERRYREVYGMGCEKLCYYPRS